MPVRPALPPMRRVPLTRSALLFLLAVAVSLASIATGASAAARVGRARALRPAPIHTAPTKTQGPATSTGTPSTRRPPSAPGAPSPPIASFPAGPTPASGWILFEDDFDGPDGLLTNEYSQWNPGSPQATPSSRWEMTSGSLFSRNGSAWTGVPDGCASSSPHSTPCTASDVFRLNTAEDDFGDVTVSMDLLNNRLSSSPRTPPVAWDGVHIWLHRQSEFSLYYASFNRRDGQIVIKKKCPGGSENGGTYYVLPGGVQPGHPIPFGVVQHLAARIDDEPGGSVTVTMYRDGARLLSATDEGIGCAPITAPGSVGVRGDNDDFEFDRFTVAQS